MTTAFADNLIKYFELIAGLTGIVFYFKKRRVIWFAFAVFLVCLFGMEVLGQWLGQQKMVIANTNLYKWFIIPLLFTSYHLMYYSFSSKKVKPFIIYSLFVFILMALIENLYLSKQHFYTISITLGYGCTAILLFSLNYFFWLLKDDALLHYRYSMPFWFCTGLLVFYLGSFPYLVLFNSLGFSVNKAAYNLFRWCFIFLNYIMYLLFTIGFLWSKPK